MRESGGVCLGDVCVLWGKSHGISKIGSHLSGDSLSNAAVNFLALRLQDNLFFFCDGSYTFTNIFLAFCLVNIVNFINDSSRGNL